MTTRLYENSVFLEHETPAGHPERADRLRSLNIALEHPNFSALERVEAQIANEDAVTLGAGLLAAVASGHFADIGAASAAMVRPGGTVTPDPATRAYHDAKYNVFLSLYDQGRAARAAMAAF